MQPLYILKRELTRIPFFGWYLMKAGMIAVDRTRRRPRAAEDGAASQRGSAARPPVDHLSGRHAPAGRRAAGLQARRRADLCDCGVTCLPVALNSGLFWPRRTFMRYPGTLVVEFLDPLPPGLPRDEFLARDFRRDRGSDQPAGRGGAAASRRSCSAACRSRHLRSDV